MKKFSLCTIILGGIVFAFPSEAVTADHLVISQVQITGGAGKTTNDFVEIYNPTAADIDLKGFRLVKRTKTGTSDTPLKSWTDSAIVKAHGFYLWANSSFTDIAITPDATTTASIADDNGIALRQGANDSGTIIDSAAWGEAANSFIEGAVFATNPAASQSLERSEDTNNNAGDFFLQIAAHPRNSQSASSSPPPAAPSPPPVSPSPSPAAAAPAPTFSLEFSEIMPNPKGKDQGNEWVELYNGGAQAFDLSKWMLDDDSEQDLPGSSAWTLPEGTTLAAHQYLALTIPKGRFSLNNAKGDAVRLFDSTKILRLRQVYPGPAKEGHAFARDDLNVWAWTDTATPGVRNTFAPPASYARDIIISEALPNPEGDDAEGEFIELYNAGSGSADLSDWILSDNRKRYRLSEDDLPTTEIGSRDFLVLYREVTGIGLNNSGEEHLTLMSPDGDKVVEIKFDAAGREGQSYAWNGQRHQWTAFLSPGQKNEFRAPAAKAPGNSNNDGAALPVALAKVRELPAKAQVKTQGVVSAEPGIFGDNMIYLAGSGIRIVFENLPEFAIRAGDRISLEGVVDSYHSEAQLRIANSTSVTLMSRNEPVERHEIKTGEVGEATEGFLVSVAGQVTQKSEDTFFLDDGSGPARIYLGKSTGIESPDLKKGQEAAVTGIVSQFDENYRILPRYASDIAAGEVAGAQTGASLPRTGLDPRSIFALFFGIWYIGFGVFILKLGKENKKNEQSGTG